MPYVVAVQSGHAVRCGRDVVDDDVRRRDREALTRVVGNNHVLHGVAAKAATQIDRGDLRQRRRVPANADTAQRDPAGHHESLRQVARPHRVTGRVGTNREGAR
jgi:hypothetical protein